MKKTLDINAQRQLIQGMISKRDYQRALFVLQNANDCVRVRKNLVQFYSIDEIKNSAHHIITNYQMPHFTFDKMRVYIDDDAKIVKLLRASVPQWQRAVNAMFRARKRWAMRQK